MARCRCLFPCDRCADGGGLDGSLIFACAESPLVDDISEGITPFKSLFY